MDISMLKYCEMIGTDVKFMHYNTSFTNMAIMIKMILYLEN